MESDEELRADVLYVALTRPTTKFGVPDGAFIFEVGGTGIVFIATGNPLYLLAVVPIHALLYLISHKDPAIFSALNVWKNTIGRCRNKGFWKSASFSPLPNDKWRDFSPRRKRGF